MNKSINYILFLLLIFAFKVRSQNASVIVDAATITGTLNPVWGDHYDLSMNHAWGNFTANPGFYSTMQQLKPRYWRCSIGRWEIGYPAPIIGSLADTNVLKTCEREFYRGGNSLTEADNPASYYFAYLDTQLVKIKSSGAEPLLCFDYMPFTLSSIRSTGNAYDYSANLSYTFSNGIRTSPPLSPAVYARVVKNVMLHTRGLFAGTANYNINYFEIGNEPDLPPAPEIIFWTGTQADFFTMYAAIATEVNADASLGASVKLGAGSFAYIIPATSFASSFMNDISANNTRLDFLSYHSYSDNYVDHYISMQQLDNLRNTYKPAAELLNCEWGRALDGSDPVYDDIEHGIFRARVMMLMQLFNNKVGAEALFINTPLVDTSSLGLLFGNPIRNKPAADVYLGFNKFNTTLNALNLAVSPAGEFCMAGKNNANDRICIAYIAPDPGAGNSKQVNMAVGNLPWGNAPYYAYQYEVSQQTWQNDQGVSLVKSQALNGNVFLDSVLYGPGPGAGRVIFWELSSTPLTGVAMANGLESLQCSIYPNPASGDLIIHSGDLDAARIEIRNMFGDLVLSTITDKPLKRINVKGWASGLYTVNLLYKNGRTVIKKVIIE
ncbi:MAG: T9SS type A sorting domain-containing protein [Bacteroidia bacterium]